MKLFLVRRVLGQKVPCPCQRERGGFVPCEKERHHFVTKLFVSHAATILVAGLREHGEEIAGIDLIATASGDNSANGFIEPADRAAELDHRRSG